MSSEGLSSLLNCHACLRLGVRLAAIGKVLAFEAELGDFGSFGSCTCKDMRLVKSARVAVVVAGIVVVVVVVVGFVPVAETVVVDVLV